MLKRNIHFYERKKETTQNMNFARKEKFVFRILWIKETLILWIFQDRRRSF